MLDLLQVEIICFLTLNFYLYYSTIYPELMQLLEQLILSCSVRPYEAALFRCDGHLQACMRIRGNSAIKVRYFSTTLYVSSVPFAPMRLRFSGAT